MRDLLVNRSKQITFRHNRSLKFRPDQPCPMCMTAALVAGVDRVVYGTVVRRPDAKGPPAFAYSAKEFARNSIFRCQVDGPVEEALCRALVDDPLAPQRNHRDEDDHEKQPRVVRLKAHVAAARSASAGPHLPVLFTEIGSADSVDKQRELRARGSCTVHELDLPSELEPD